MFEFFKKKMGSNQHIQQTYQKQSQYKIVEQYTLVPPNKLLTDYSLFESSKTIPVAYEQKSGTGWNKTILLPNKLQIRNFLQQLKDADFETIQDAKYRTVSVIKIGDGKNIYIVPNLKHKDIPSIVVHFEKQDKYPWPYYITPEINRVIVEQLKFYTR